jgi:hypothetical protein
MKIIPVIKNRDDTHREYDKEVYLLKRAEIGELLIIGTYDRRISTILENVHSRGSYVITED